MYKKVLVILHDSILPHMGDPTLMIDFLTAAYNVGEFVHHRHGFVTNCSTQKVQNSQKNEAYDTFRKP